MLLQQQITQQVKPEPPWYQDIADLFWKYKDAYDAALVPYWETGSSNDYSHAHEIGQDWAEVSDLLKEAMNYQGECSCAPDGWACIPCQLRAEAVRLGENLT